MTFRAAGIAIFLVLFANVVNLALGIFERYPNVDVPLHLGGGFAMGMLALAILTRLRSAQKAVRLPPWFVALFMVSFTALAAVLWEFHEFVLDHTLVLTYRLPATQLSLDDTLDDLLNGLIGSVAAWMAFGRCRSKS